MTPTVAAPKMPDPLPPVAQPQGSKPKPKSAQPTFLGTETAPTPSAMGTKTLLGQ